MMLIATLSQADYDMIIRQTVNVVGMVILHRERGWGGGGIEGGGDQGGGDRGGGGRGGGGRGGGD